MSDQVTERGRHRIQRLEGYREKPYRDADGWSVGWGHYLGDVGDVPFETYSRTYLVEECKAFFRDDLATLCESPLASIARIRAEAGRSQLAAHERDALAGFAYNVGPVFATSEVFEAAATYVSGHSRPAALMLEWTLAGGVRNRDLVEHRRIPCYLLYLFGDYGD